MELVDDEHPHLGRSQQHQCLSFQVRNTTVRPDRCSQCGEHREVEPTRRGFRGHLDAQHRDLFAVTETGRRVRASELLDDHRLAVVRRAEQQQVRHTLTVRPRQQRLEVPEDGPCLRVADPALGAYRPNSGGVIEFDERPRRLRQVPEVGARQRSRSPGGRPRSRCHLLTTARCRRRSTRPCPVRAGAAAATPEWSKKVCRRGGSGVGGCGELCGCPSVHGR